ncbi:MAG: class I SAM-dependent methyltransferase [Alphaproteobacteria bacterium]
MLLARMLGGVITKGRVTFIDPAGRAHDLGCDDGRPPVVMRVRDRLTELRLVLHPYAYAGEAYMDGGLVIEQGSLADWMAICYENFERAAASSRFRRVRNWLHRALRPITQYNPVGRARRHVAHHYDLSDALFDQFLDKDRQYSCAYFATPNHNLDQAQDAKKRHIAAKLLLEPGMKVLDIGSGWGGLALYLARTANVDVTGVTLSVEQQQFAERRARDAGLADRVRFHLRDYRLEPGRYDRVVSVGMFEHVGARHFGEFFRKLGELMNADGVALLHSIGRFDGPGATNTWLRKYIFPGGYTPALSEVAAAVERSGLVTTDIEILRLHYAETIKAWQRRFALNRDAVKAMYDERFCRMWEFYLTATEMAFRYGGQMVFQMQLAHRLDAVPLTRDYVVDWEREHALVSA